MKTSLFLTLLMAGGVSVALAQGPYPRDGYGGRYRDYDRGNYNGNRREDVVGRVMNNLSQAGGYGWMDHRDQKRLDHAFRDLMRFQEKWSRGRYDRGRLDSAIGHLQQAVNSNRIDPRRRDRLARDLYDLRDFRARGSYNGDPYGRPY